MTSIALLILQLCNDHAVQWHDDPAWEGSLPSMIQHGDYITAVPWSFDTKSRKFLADGFEPGFEQCEKLLPELKHQKDIEDAAEAKRILAEKNAADAKALKDAIAKLRS